MSNNIYYQPEAFGLTTIGEAEFSSGSYKFDTTVVWKDAAGAFYYADDSGWTSITKIERLQDLIDHLEERKRESYYYEGNEAEIDGACASLIQAYRKARA